MTTTLIIGLPVLTILFIVITLKLRTLLSVVLIIILGIASPFVMDFVYCSVLNNECKPDALEAVGFLFLAIYVITTSLVVYAITPKKLKQKTVQGSTKQIDVD